MPTHSTLPLVDAVTDAIARNDIPSEGSIRTRAAFVRSLVDELARHHPADARVAGLHEQIGEELARLATELGGSAAPVAEAPIDVLVVDDDDDSRAAIMSVLRMLGFPCRAASSGEAALEEYAREPAAIVVTDWMMPGMTGLDLCHELKRRYASAYVILATAFRENERLLDGALAGADDFLHKPVDVDELAMRLRAAERLVQAVRVIRGLQARLAKTTP